MGTVRNIVGFIKSLTAYEVWCYIAVTLMFLLTIKGD